jgi:hypothetical protein
MVVTDGETILTKWRAWLESIRVDVAHLHLNRHLWRELVAIVRANPAIPEPGHIMGWFATLYGTTQAIGIRRHADRSTQAITLGRLLKEIRDRPDVVSRERYLSFYGKVDDFQRRLAHEEYDEFAGKRRDVVAVDLVEADLRMLDENTRQIAQYATRRIAHLDARTIDEVPTYNDLDGALEELERLLKRYTLLLRCEALTSAQPTPNYNWQGALTVPWIPPEDHFEPGR